MSLLPEECRNLLLMKFFQSKEAISGFTGIKHILISNTCDNPIHLKPTPKKKLPSKINVGALLRKSRFDPIVENLKCQTIQNMAAFDLWAQVIVGKFNKTPGYETESIERIQIMVDLILDLADYCIGTKPGSRVHITSKHQLIPSSDVIADYHIFDVETRTKTIVVVDEDINKAVRLTCKYLKLYAKCIQSLKADKCMVGIATSLKDWVFLCYFKAENESEDKTKRFKASKVWKLPYECGLSTTTFSEKSVKNLEEIALRIAGLATCGRDQIIQMIQASGKASKNSGKDDTLWLKTLN